MIYVLGAIYVVCGLISWAGTIAYFDREFPTIAHLPDHRPYWLASFLALIGPIGVFVVLSQGGFKHGLKFK